MKTVWLTWIFHGNMSYDRYTKQTIRSVFPKIYQLMIEEFHRYPELKGHVELSGLTVQTLKKWSPEILAGLKDLAEREQISFTGSYYAAPVNACLDGNTNLQAMQLGVKIIEDALGPVDGFFCQEKSYTPQLPWALSQLGIRWLAMPGEEKHQNPYILRGFDGTKVYGIPMTFGSRRYQLRDYIRTLPDRSLIVFTLDYEMYYPLGFVLELMEELRSEGIQLRIGLVPEYLEKHPPKEEIFYGVRDRKDVDESPWSGGFSRWVSDPKDIFIHDLTMQASNYLRAARIARALAQKHWGKDLNPDAELVPALAPDLRTLKVEQPAEFSEVVDKYLTEHNVAGLLEHAEHLLLWGVNSDSRGWFPLEERRWEHAQALRKSRRLSAEVTHRFLKQVAQRVRLNQSGTPYFLYNDTGERDAFLELKVPEKAQFIDDRGEILPTSLEATTEGEGYRLRFLVHLPAFGYHTVYLVPNDDLPVEQMSPGNSIGTSELDLVYQQDQLLVRTAAGRQVSLALQLPAIIRELTQKAGLCTRELKLSKDAYAWTVESAFPRLVVHQELDFGLHFIQEYTVCLGGVLCQWQFDFSRPYLLGEKEHFRIDGITALLRTAPGSAFYDAGYAVLTHPGDTEDYICALHSAGMQCDEGFGILATSLSGAQSFEIDPSKGHLGLCLGASTAGGPSSRPTAPQIHPQTKEVTHFYSFDEEMFHGRYSHKFFLKIYEGNWQENDVITQQLDLTRPVPKLRGELHTGKSQTWPATQSLLSLELPNVVLQDAVFSQGQLRLLINEVAGSDTVVKVNQRDIPVHSGEVKECIYG
ncbi:MAG TPA: hypothetical protein GXX57_07555 [Firmicutes bacterium]|nr:hypothetical protein [Bacillota bacterium]